MRNFCPMNYHTWESVPEDAKNLMYEKLEINPETQMPPSPLELYHKLHFNATKQGWLNENSRIEYVSIF
ncbi:hypothetical protein Hanom_Chr07g00636271 [Helianthus anomalus]